MGHRSELYLQRCFRMASIVLESGSWDLPPRDYACAGLLTVSTPAGAGPQHVGRSKAICSSETMEETMAKLALPQRDPRCTSLPMGVELRPLTMHRDDRGVFTEVFRAT